MINYANNDVIVAPDGKWLDFGIEPIIYRVYTTGVHGSITASPNSGYTGTEVALSNTPDSGYVFSSYTYTGTGASLSGNLLTIGTSDVHVVGNFEEYVDPYNPLKLPPNTVRVRTKDGYPPNNPNHYETATHVTGTADEYDVYKSGTSFEDLLSSCSNVTAVLGANTTGITNMSHMLGSCYSLTSVPLFDTSSVTDMSIMFGGCTLLASVPLYDTSNVTNMHGMFTGCTALTTVPLFNTSKVTDMSSMFSYECTSLTTVPLFDTSNVTNMSSMFSNCTSLTTVPLFNTSKVTNMSTMFTICTSLTAIPLFDTSSVTNMQAMFNQCYKVESGALALYQQASSQATPPTSHYRTFYLCGRDTTTGSAELAQIPSDWK